MSTNSNPSTTMTFDFLCALLGVDTVDKFMDRCAYWDTNFPSNMTEEEINEEVQRLESQAFDAYVKAVTSVASELFSEHGLELTSSVDDSYTFFLEPQDSWEGAANAIRETINGYGMFEFSSLDEMIQSSSCEDARACAIGHLHWIPKFFEVYGSGTAKGKVEHKLERALRYL